MALFTDRRQAGEELSKHLKDEIEADKIFIPYLESFEVAKEFIRDNNSDVVFRLSEFISSPDSPNVKLGAVVEDGTIWVEDVLRNELKVRSEYIENTATIKSNYLRERSFELQGDMNMDLKGEEVVVVSDGVSNGFREAAVAGSLRKEGAEKIHVVAPFVSRNMIADLSSVADELHYVHELSFIDSASAAYGEKKATSERRN